eukprot:Gregarina_sp_Poly_1__6805@NODE_367_length_9168_cov_132_626415_g303_i0_p2_GENE_NODE_367_length_9168_cov_132_626415_g303_i0NODE_367_length_9168_cov_132_626415_g303_i0_p2_ORF_typecomplete_len615_score89_70MMR_HSR1/PF01926_23/1_9e03MMR_HSR1/PF01926_23/1_1e14RsgA_GTPase/PF03193_16/3_9e05RsgA_GTPase/PF03193_16/8_1e06FeoB_N/PF02421_18/0_16FeoB_N/PF02421_18/4_7e08MnmE_helical/PF12631_7/9_9e02MnmE_helical/PF12631_7/1_1e02MnmE_helical/PF12631_7/6_1e02MnmE_helical/PF12631_7/0_003IIGP/PF05049_13/4_4e03IIGP/
MPSGRKSGTKVKGGGFGRSLVNANKTSQNVIAFDKPDYRRLRSPLGSSAEVKITDFVSKERCKVSQIDGNCYDEFLHKTYAEVEGSNLVIVQDRQRLEMTSAKPEVVCHKDVAPGLFSAKGRRSLFYNMPVSSHPPFSCPERPFLFRNPAARVLDFARFAVKGASIENEAVMINTCAALSASDVMNALEGHFGKRENFAPLLDAESLGKEEQAAFSRWRNSISALEQQYCLTPYEKNLEYWKQLWRTVERSDLVLEIVDARNPLLFMNPSFRLMVERQGREHVVVMNKSDFLEPELLKSWKAYFEAKNIEVIFYSALKELENQKLQASIKEGGFAPLTTEMLRRQERRVEEETSASLSEASSCSNIGEEAHQEEGEVESELDELKDMGCAPTTEKLREQMDVFGHFIMDYTRLTHFLEQRGQVCGHRKWCQEQLASQLWDILHAILAPVAPESKRRLYKKLWKQAHAVKAEDLASEKLNEREIFTNEEFSTSSIPVPQNVDTELLSILLGPREALECHEAAPPSPRIEEHFSTPVVGVCGFPNVGKSSVINSLMKGRKRVGVSRTPGKTRHLQTLQVPDQHFILCDAPGLIFPVAAATKEHLILNNILSADTFR